MLPNSTERAVTVSGSSEAITQCIFHICTIMSEVSQSVSGKDILYTQPKCQTTSRKYTSHNLIPVLAAITASPLADAAQGGHGALQTNQAVRHWCTGRIQPGGGSGSRGRSGRSDQRRPARPGGRRKSGGLPARTAAGRGCCCGRRRCRQPEPSPRIRFPAGRLTFSLCAFSMSC